VLPDKKQQVLNILGKHKHRSYWDAGIKVQI